MSEFNCPEAPDIGSEQQEQFIECVKSFEPYLELEEGDPREQIYSANFEIDKTRVLIYTYYDDSQLDTDYRVVVFEPQEADDSDLLIRKIKSFVVTSHRGSNITDSHYDEEVEFKTPQDDNFKPFISREDVLLARLAEIIFEKDQSKVSDQEFERLAGEFSKEISDRLDLENITGEYSTVFTQERFHEVMGILGKINPGKHKV